MLINSRNLLHLPVYTQSGRRLGRVCDFQIEAETHRVNSYIAKANILKQKTYLIKPSQVIEINSERMTVEDGVLKVEEAVRYKIQPAKIAADTAMSALSEE